MLPLSLCLICFFQIVTVHLSVMHLLKKCNRWSKRWGLYYTFKGFLNYYFFKCKKILTDIVFAWKRLFLTFLYIWNDLFCSKWSGEKNICKYALLMLIIFLQNRFQGSRSKLTDVSFAVEKVSDEPGATEKPMNRLSSNRKEEMKSGYWTRVVKIINRAFLIFYVSAVTLFLGVMFIMWNSSEDDDG